MTAPAKAVEVVRSGSLRDVARKLAQAYLLRLKSRNAYACPWDRSLSIEETPVWAHFVKAARVVNEMEAEPKQYIAAQFEAISRFGKHKVPFPSQLANTSARLWYIEWMEKRELHEMKLAKPEHMTTDDPLKHERIKVRCMAKRFGVSEVQVLRQMPLEFSESFHREQGTWKVVRKLFADE